MLIKVCGLTDAKTAAQCVLHGSDYIGLLFSDKSIRKIDLDNAVKITKAVREVNGEVIAVFVDEEYDEILHIIKELDLKIIQLHGDKVRAYVDRFDESLQIVYVIDKNIPIPSSLKPSRDFLLFEKIVPPKECDFRFFVAGKINNDNVEKIIKLTNCYGVDLSSSLESSPAVKDLEKVKAFIKAARPERFGPFGGRYVPELLIPPLQELEEAYNSIAKTTAFRDELYYILKNHIGRPTPLTEVKNFANDIQAKFRIFLKREDLLHTGAHKINNALGQCLLAKKMGKTRIVAETGAGQHGVATATACAMFGLECIVYMGAIDIERQAPNVAKMRLLGAKVVSVESGTATLKDAVNDALRDWAHSYSNTHYCLGSALGPHPFPTMVADFHRVIGMETREQLQAQYGLTANKVIACVGGGSNAIGIFGAFINDLDVELIGVEAGGYGLGLGNNAARFSEGTPVYYMVHIRIYYKMIIDK